MIRQCLSRLALLAVVATTIGCDQVSKHLATSHLMGAAPQSFLGDSLRLEYARNTGAFLSLGAGLPAELRTATFSFGTAILLAACVVAIVRHSRMTQRGVTGGKMTSAALGLALVVAGGVSNLAERVAHRAVIDFLNVGLGSLRTGIFNVADMAIMTGVGIIRAFGASAEKAWTIRGAIPIRDEFEQFLRSIGLTQELRRGPEGEPFGNWIIQYGNNDLSVSLVHDRGDQSVFADKHTLRPPGILPPFPLQYDVNLIREMVTGAATERMGYHDQKEFVRANGTRLLRCWARIAVSQRTSGSTCWDASDLSEASVTGQRRFWNSRSSCKTKVCNARSGR